MLNVKYDCYIDLERNSITGLTAALRRFNRENGRTSPSDIPILSSSPLTSRKRSPSFLEEDCVSRETHNASTRLEGCDLGGILSRSD